MSDLRLRFETTFLLFKRSYLDVEGDLLILNCVLLLHQFGSSINPLLSQIFDQRINIRLKLKLGLWILVGDIEVFVILFSIRSNLFRKNNIYSLLIFLLWWFSDTRTFLLDLKLYFSELCIDLNHHLIRISIDLKIILFLLADLHLHLLYVSLQLSYLSFNIISLV